MSYKTLENDYLEMVDLVKQVNEAQNAKLPGTYDKASAKKATHLYRLCGTLTEQKIMKKLLKLDLVETKGNQDIRAVRKAIIRRINRYLQVGDELKRYSKASVIERRKEQNGRSTTSTWLVKTSRRSRTYLLC